MSAVLGDAQPIQQRWLQPRVGRLLALGVELRQTYQDLYIADDEEDYRSNSWLREIYDELSVFWRENPFDLDYVDLAETLSTKCSRLFGRARAGLIPWQDCESAVREMLTEMSLSFPKGDSLETSLARLEDAAWWKKAFRRSLPRVVDQASRRHGVVHQSRQPYLCDAALSVYRRSVSANRTVLESLDAVSEMGERINLLDVADRSLSKAANRRAEYLVRSRGIEEYAATLGYQALFLTLTAPSKYHCRLTSGVRNPKWNGTTPREVQGYLQSVWQRARAAFARAGIDYFGVRIVEPHHDGTPHWHVLVYVEKSEQCELTRLLERYSLAEDGNEPGAREHRLKTVTIDPARGSATGYVAKYISKSVDGYAIDQDLLGNNAIDSAERIVAWSRIWGIRQFQTFGTPPIGVYRELRRVREPASPIYEPVRVAADHADYCLVLQYGKAMQLQTFREPWIDSDGVCESPYTRYGDLKKLPVRGVEALSIEEGERLYTRLVRWTIERREEIAPSWTCVNNCTGGHAGFAGSAPYISETGPPGPYH